MIGQPQRGTEEEMERARALIKSARDASGLTWRAFAARLGEKDGGNLQQWADGNPARPGARRALVFAAFLLDLPVDDCLMLLRLAKLEGLLEVARNSRVLSGPVSPEQAAIAVGDLSRHSAADVLRSGRLLEAAAYDADFDGDWERAYTLCLAAEVAYGPASANAPLMVVRAAEMLLKLGDYQTIDGLMRRLDASYLTRRGPLGSVSDPFTWGSAELVRAQIALHHARYADALVHARRALDVVQYGEGRLDAWHALGRAYAGLARQCRPMAAQLIRNSKRAFRAAMEQHRAAGMESSLGYDHLRVAFMQRGVGVDIARARELLSTRLGSFHLAIFDGARSDSPRMRRARIEEAQTITSRLRYRGGLARSYFLAAAEDAEARTRRQRLDSAYGFAATYVAFPLDDNPQAIRALHDLGSVIRDGSDALSRSEMEHWLERFESDLRNHEGSFRLLAQLRGDTRQAEDAVMGKAKESLAREREANSLLPISAPQCPRSPQGCHLCRPAPMPSIYGRKARP